MTQGLSKRHVGERSIAADTDLFVLQVSRTFDTGSGYDRFQELIHTAGDEREIRAFRPRANG